MFLNSKFVPAEYVIATHTHTDRQRDIEISGLVSGACQFQTAVYSPSPCSQLGGARTQIIVVSI